MSELGRLEDLPADYVAALAAQNLVPLWPNLRAVLPPYKPRPKASARSSYTSAPPSDAATEPTHCSVERMR